MIIVAGLLEVVWVSGLKHSTTLLGWIGTAALILFSFYIMIKTFRVLPVGTVYAVFTGLGTAGTVAGEMLFFDEPFDPVKVSLILVLLIGVIGLKIVTGETQTKGGDA